jgi:tetratricopeptide (TPR) repeat protein
MLPVSNWIIPTAVTVAERYLYVPSFGIALIAGFVWARIPGIGTRRLVTAGVMTAAVLLCISQTFVWRNDFTFFRNMVRVLPNNTSARQGYGVALLRLNRPEEARLQFEEGLRIGRSEPLLMGLAGLLIQQENSCSTARPLLEEAVRGQGSYHARWILGECHEREGNMKDAEEEYRRAVIEAPIPDAKLLFSWAFVLEQTGRTAEALDVYQKAALLDPVDPAIQERMSALPAGPAP